MSKLIYSPTSTILEGTFDNIRSVNSVTNPVYYAVAYTGDGYMYTHGKKFRLFNVINDTIDGVSFLITNGVAGVYIDGTSVGTAGVVQSITGDGIVNVTTTDGAASISHASYLNVNQAGSYGSSSLIPIITVNQSGHITAIQNSGTIDVSKIRADATTTLGVYYPIGVTDNTLLNPLYNTSLSFDENGNLYANNLYIGNSALSTLFAPYAHISAYADGTNYGHVLLSDSVDDTKDVDEHIAATPKAVSAGVLSANQHSNALFAALDAMVFAGTIDKDGILTSHNTTVISNAEDNVTALTYLDYKVGWTFRFIESGTFNGEEIEVGDMLIAVHRKRQEFSINDWTIIQTNISGALTANSTLSGLLYANNSRIVNALTLSDGILKYSNNSLSFVNPNTLWRDIQINSTSIGTNAFNLIPGTAITLTELNGNVTVAVNASTIIANTATLTLNQGLLDFVYKPNANATLTIGENLTLEKDENDNFTLRHKSITSISNKLGRITTDGYGHVTSLVEVNTLPNPYSLTFKISSGSVLEYDGNSSNKVIVLDNGTDIAFTASENIAGEKVITPAITHKYRGVQFYPTAASVAATPLLANNVSTFLTLVGGENITLTNKDANNDDLPAGTLMIHADDTWRSVEAYKFQSNVLSRSSIGTNPLYFGDDFIVTNSELGLMWTEIDEDGRVTYVK